MPHHAGQAAMLVGRLSLVCVSGCVEVERKDDIPSFLQGDDIAAVTKDDLSGCQPTQNILPKRIKRII